MCCGLEKTIKTIGVLTSGDCCPGKNSLIYNVVRMAVFKGFLVKAIVGGFKGLIDNKFFDLSVNDVRGACSKGGSIISSGNLDEIETDKGIEKAYFNCEQNGLDVLIVIGGYETNLIAEKLSQNGISTIYIPASIFNDIPCSDYSIGFHSAASYAIDEIDRLNDIEQNVPRCDVVEVFGTDNDMLALGIAACCEATSVLIPSIEYDLERDVVERILYYRRMGRTHFTIVVSNLAGNALRITEFVESRTGIETHSIILGRTIFGGKALSYDRIMANKFAKKAVDLINDGVFDRAVALKHGQVVDFSLKETVLMKKTFDRGLYLNTVSIIS